MPTRSPRSVVTFPIMLRELTVLRAENITPGCAASPSAGPSSTPSSRTAWNSPPCAPRASTTT